jgi:uncharacterized small protein (DUF1192 family)
VLVLWLLAYTAGAVHALDATPKRCISSHLHLLSLSEQQQRIILPSSAISQVLQMRTSSYQALSCNVSNAAAALFRCIACLRAGL